MKLFIQFCASDVVIFLNSQLKSSIWEKISRYQIKLTKTKTMETDNCTHRTLHLPVLPGTVGECFLQIVLKILASSFFLGNLGPKQEIALRTNPSFLRHELSNLVLEQSSLCGTLDCKLRAPFLVFYFATFLLRYFFYIILCATLVFF